MEPVKDEVLDAGLLSRTISIKGRDGVTRKFSIWEMETPDLEKFMEGNKSSVDAVVVDGKMQIKGMRSYKGMFTNLLRLCVKDEAGKFVDVEILNTWPARVQQKVYEIASELNTLTPESQKKAEDEAKNLPTGNENG